MNCNYQTQQINSYVYWTVHHLDSWVKRDQLDVTCFIISLFNAQHVSDVNTSILRSLRIIRWVTSWVVSGSMCVGVTLQCGYGGVVSVCRLQPAYGYHATTTKPQRNTNTHRTRYNPWSNSTNYSQAPEDGCINIRNMLSTE